MEYNYFTMLCVSAVQKHESTRSSYILSLLSLPPTPSSHLSRLAQSTELRSLLYSSFSLVTYFTHSSVYMLLLSVHPTLSFPLCVHKIILFTCMSIHALQIGSPVLFFSRIHICTSMHACSVSSVMSNSVRHYGL